MKAAGWCTNLSLSQLTAMQTVPPTHRCRRASAAATGTMQGSPTAGALISCSATSGRSMRGGACKGRAKGTGRLCPPARSHMQCCVETHTQPASAPASASDAIQLPTRC